MQIGAPRYRDAGDPEDLGGRRDLHDPSDVHHRHAVADVLHNAKVVRNEEVGQPQIVLQVFEEVEDLGLDRDIES